MASSTVTREVLRQALDDATGFFYAGTATSNGTTSTIVDTGIQSFDTGRVKDKFILATSGSNDGEVTRVSSVSSSTINISPDFSNATSSGDTYEVLWTHPNWLHAALADGLRTSYPEIYLPVLDETQVVDDRLTNSLFETFSGGFTGWTEVGSPTVTQETSIVFQGSSSAKVVASGADGQLTQSPQIDVKEIVGKTVIFERWVATDTADAARVRLDWNGSDFANSEYHSGEGASVTSNAIHWERLRVEGTVPDDATQVKAICETVDGNTAYFDGPGGLWVPATPITEYTIPTSIVALHNVLMQDRRDEPNGPYYRLSRANWPRSGHVLRLEGKGRLTVPTSDAGTTEIDDAQAEAVVARAAQHLFQRLARIDVGSREMHLEDAGLWERRYAELVRRPAIRTPRMAASSRIQGVWWTEEDANGRHLYLDRGRR